MAVPASDRGESKFELLVKANALAVYTLQITSNAKVFDPVYANALGNKIQAAATDIFINCWTANNIRPMPETNLRERHKLQRLAVLQCNNLLAMIEIAYKLYHLESRRVEHWGALIIEVRNMIRAWSQSDSKRYKNK